LEAFSKKQTKKFERRRLAESKRAGIETRKAEEEQRGQETEARDVSSPIGKEADLEADQESEAVFQSALQSYDSLSQLSGGPVGVFDYAGARMGAPWDHGQQLVELIQSTIDPAFWRDSGGSGSIEYYRPSRVLVISGSRRVQELTEDLLWKLRAAN